MTFIYNLKGVKKIVQRVQLRNTYKSNSYVLDLQVINNTVKCKSLLVKKLDEFDKWSAIC